MTVQWCIQKGKLT